MHKLGFIFMITSTLLAMSCNPLASGDGLKSQINGTDVTPTPNPPAPTPTGSLYFLDANSYLEMSPGIVIGGTTTTPFTIEGWFFCAGSVPGTGPQPALLSTSVPGSDGALTVNIAADRVVVDANGKATTNFTVPSMVADAWYYVAVSRDISGFIQVWMGKLGDVSAVASSSGRFLSTADYTFSGTSNTIGKFVPASRDSRNSYISNLRITNTNLFSTSDPIINMPTSYFMEVTGTLLLINDDTLTDQSGGQTLTEFSTVEGSAVAPF